MTPSGYTNWIPGGNFALGVSMYFGKPWARQYAGEYSWKGTIDLGVDAATAGIFGMAGKGLRSLRFADEFAEGVFGSERGLGRVTGSFDAINPGPLSDDLAGTFAGGRYSEIILESDTILYRAGQTNKPLGEFFDTVPAEGVLQSRIDKAILPIWPGGGCDFGRRLHLYHRRTRVS